MGCGSSSLVSQSSGSSGALAIPSKLTAATPSDIKIAIGQHPANGAATAAGTTTAAAGAAQAAAATCPVLHSPHAVEEVHNGHTVLVARCPLGHGSVGTGPFPGYVHGTHAAVCAEGCRPDPLLGKYGRKGETPQQTLIREALEYQDLYHKEKHSSAAIKAARVAEVLDEIARSGMYTHTFDELQHGARVAWRNAPKCCNRKFWEELKLLDARQASTPEQMHNACLEMLERATLSCVTTTNIAVFRPQTPGTQDGPRVWNNQLIRFAGYKRLDGSIAGDPSEVEFTEMCIKQFGWQPPAEGDGMFDVLPLILQPHPDQAPQMFHLPDQYVVRVPIRHPDNEAFSELGLQWYTVPAVSNMELSVGGLTYTAVPFNGWYADTEIVRNLTDATRFNVCAKVAATLNLDSTDDASMWRDRAIVEVAFAVMHSFRQAGMGMVDHHTLMRNFFTWWNKEKTRRGYSPGNWKWIITPLSPTASRCYLELNKMTEYTIKPGYWYAPGWRQYRKASRELLRVVSDKSRHISMDTKRLSGGGALRPVDPASSIVIMYASVTGNTQQYAEAVAAALSVPGLGLAATLLSMDDFESDNWADVITQAQCVLVMSSTYGPGAPPHAANKFIAWLQASNNEAREALEGKPCCVLGFGSSCYPRFCAAAELFHTLLLSVGACPMLGVAKVDALSGEEQAVWAWVQSLVQKLEDMECLTSSQAADLVQRLPITDVDKPPEFHQEFRLVQLAGEGLQPAPERGCHWAKVVESTEQLANTAGEASTKLLKLDISQGGIGTYIAGDAVCIWGENEEELVHRFAGQLGIPPEQLDDLFLLQSIQGGDGEDLLNTAAKGRFPLPNSYRTILTRHAGLNERISFAAIAGLAGYAPEDVLLQRLAGSYSEYSAWCSDVVPRWQDLFTLFPVLVLRVPLATFFQLVPVIKPRYYSISSSGVVTPREVAVTVGRLTYTLHTGEKRAGFCSSFISRVKPGDRLRLRLVSQPAFRMPLNLTAPVVMVAAGTGIAPFRGFWHERLLRLQQEQQLGPAILVFGCRSRKKDFILGAEVEAMIEKGAIQHLLLAMSRDHSMRKTYVQDIIKQKAVLLKSALLHERCHVYVCGSSNMAHEVSAAMSKVVGKEVLDSMVQAGRYHEDVFGINIMDHKAARQKSAALQAIKCLAAQSLTAVQVELDKGMDINTVDETGSTLLHHGCRAKRTDLVYLLLARGASTNIVTLMGLTPAAEAAMAGHAQLAAVLEAHGCKRAGAMHKSFYAVHAAVMEQDGAALAAALAQGANPNQQDYQLVAPLHIAVVLGDTDMATQLLDAGADPNLQNRLGMTPLQLAVAHDRQAMIKLLRARGAAIQATHIIAAVNPSAELWSADSQAGLLEAAGVTVEDVARVQALWAFVSGEAFPDKVKTQLEQFGISLFVALFDMYPGLVNMFPFKDADGKPVPSELAVHGLKVASTLGELVHTLQNQSALSRYLTDMVERHYQYGVELVHYDIVIGAMAVLLDTQLGQQKLVAADREAWRKVLSIIKIVAVGCYSKRDAAAATAAAVA